MSKAIKEAVIIAKRELKLLFMVARKSSKPPPTNPTLEDLVARITPENRHEEF